MNADVSSIIVNSLTTGSIYGLIGIGFVLVVRATGVVSFAQSGFMVLGALICGSVLNHGWGLPAAIGIAVGSLLIGGGLIYRIIFARLVGGAVFVTSVATIGLATLIEAISLMQWGPATIIIPQQFGYTTHRLLGISISNVAIFTIVITVIVFAIIVISLNRTPIGLRMRSVASDSRLAGYLGVNVVGMSMLAWAVAAGTGGLAGIVFLISGGPDPGTVYSLGLTAFPAILLGGFDSVGGALIGGVLIALVQSIVSTYVSSDWEVVAGYLVLLVVLLCRPQGLFGSREVVRL